MRWGLQHISARELVEWQLYAKHFGPIDPYRRGDVQAAIVASVLANAWRKKGSKALKPEDFIPKWGKRATQSSDKIIRQRLDMIFMAVGGKKD